MLFPRRFSEGLIIIIIKCLEELTTEAICFFVSRYFITHSVSLLVIGLFISCRVEVFEWATTSSGRGAFKIRMKAYTHIYRQESTLPRFCIPCGWGARKRKNVMNYEYGTVKIK